MAFAQVTPEAALTRFVALANAGELTSPEGQSILTGEARQMATAAKSELPAADRVVLVDPSHAAARFVLRSAAGEEADAYFYLEKIQGRWAVSAYRAMAMSGMDMMLLAELKKRRQPTPEEEHQKRNLQLTLSTDRELRAWFGENRTALDELLSVTDAQSRNTRLKALGMGRISINGARTDLVIGGARDNSVGFMKAGPAGPPPVDPSTYIWVEELGGGWFLYRTT